MARRHHHLHPQPRLHRQSGHARLRVAGETFWLGRFGSPKAAAEYDRLIGEWLASGKRLPPSKPGTVQPASLASTPAPEASPVSGASAPARSAPQSVKLPPSTIDCSTGTGASRSAPTDHDTDTDGLTVGELCSRYLQWIERNRCHKGKSATSLYYGTRQATIALKDFWEYPAASFRSPNLLQVQEQLVDTPVVSRPKDPSKPPKARPRLRSTVNDTIKRIRQIFRWGVLHALVPEHVFLSLQLVPPLLCGQSRAPDREGVKPVPDDLVEVTLAELPRVAADLIRFSRLTGCRPGEARCLRACDIDTRPLPAHRGTWLWRPYRHKNQWRKKHLPRVIAIGPKAQAILAPWLKRVARRPEAHIFSPKFAERRASGGGKTTTVDTRRIRIPARNVNDHYSKDSLNQVIERACQRAGVPKWTANQLRHARLTEVRDTISLDAAQAVGGHTNTNQTENYAQVLLTKAIDAAARCG